MKASVAYCQENDNVERSKWYDGSEYVAACILRADSHHHTFIYIKTKGEGSNVFVHFVVAGNI